MKHTIMALALAGALRNEAGAEGEVPGAEKEKPQGIEVPEHVESWLAEGKKQGAKVDKLLGVAEARMSDVLLTYATHFAHLGDTAAPNDFLTGYASGFQNPQTGKVRKSEANTVFHCIIVIGDEERRVQTGIDGGKNPVYTVKRISDWLAMHDDVAGYKGYGGLIRMAKLFRGNASGQGSGGGAKRKTTVTEAQQKNVEELVPLMNVGQASVVMEKLVSATASKQNGVIVLFREMQFSCNQIKLRAAPDTELGKAHLEAAMSILDIIEAHITVIEAQAAKAAQNVAKGLHHGPTPAETAAAVARGSAKPEAEGAVANG